MSHRWDAPHVNNNRYRVTPLTGVETKIFNVSCLHVYMFTCFHVYMFTCEHVFMCSFLLYIGKHCRSLILIPGKSKFHCQNFSRGVTLSRLQPGCQWQPQPPPDAPTWLQPRCRWQPQPPRTLSFEAKNTIEMHACHQK